MPITHPLQNFWKLSPGPPPLFIYIYIFLKNKCQLETTFLNFRYRYFYDIVSARSESYPPEKWIFSWCELRTVVFKRSEGCNLMLNIEGRIHEGGVVVSYHNVNYMYRVVSNRKVCCVTMLIIYRCNACVARHFPGGGRLNYISCLDQLLGSIFYWCVQKQGQSA